LQAPNVFAGPYLDRAAELRKDAAFLESALRDPESWIVPLWRSRSLIEKTADGARAVMLAGSHQVRARIEDSQLVMLGRFRGRICFAAELEACEPPPVTPDGANFEDLRLAGGLLCPEEAGLLAYARAMVHWRSRSRYCGRCGATTVAASAGHVARCSNPDCGNEQFPRLDPAVIVLVTDGERAALGRQAAWPAGRYSTIAGFVEPGESLEDSVRREVLEETGLHVSELRYHSSQPWPFPSSLMVGFVATAEPGSVIRVDDELEDARWFSRKDIASGSPGLPPPQSVSFRLIEDWYDSGSDVPLRQTPGVKLWTSR
jgi:NAD+ diphosphatase